VRREYGRHGLRDFHGCAVRSMPKEREHQTAANPESGVSRYQEEGEHG
jgi:hypothetical protein